MPQAEPRSLGQQGQSLFGAGKLQQEPQFPAGPASSHQTLFPFSPSGHSLRHESSPPCVDRSGLGCQQKPPPHLTKLLPCHRDPPRGSQPHGARPQPSPQPWGLHPTPHSPWGVGARTTLSGQAFKDEMLGINAVPPRGAGVKELQACEPRRGWGWSRGVQPAGVPQITSPVPHLQAEPVTGDTR